MPPLFSQKRRYIKRVLLCSIIGVSILWGISRLILQPDAVSDSSSITNPNELKTPGIGLRADARILDQFKEVISPPLSTSGKSFTTLNKMGFDILSVMMTWVAEEFLSFCKQHPGEYVLDVGTGYGSLSRQALSKGMHVISNDLEMRHLIYSRKKIKDSDERLHLFLNKNPFPNLDIPAESLRAVILHRVLHFLSGKEIDIGLDNVKRWLKPGGKIFIAVLSSEHIAYRDQFLPEFEKRKKEGDPWPGMYLDVPKLFSNQAYALPDKLHPMDQEILQKALERHGFEIERVGYISMIGFSTELNRDGKETIGIIGVKKK